MPWFRKKVLVEAIRFTGHNDVEVILFCAGQAIDPATRYPSFIIKTREGDLTAEVGDWILKGPQGEVWPVKPDIFRETYEEVPPPLVALTPGFEIS